MCKAHCSFVKDHIKLFIAHVLIFVVLLAASTVSTGSLTIILFDVRSLCTFYETIKAQKWWGRWAQEGGGVGAVLHVDAGGRREPTRAPRAAARALRGPRLPLARRLPPDGGPRGPRGRLRGRYVPTIYIPLSTCTLLLLCSYYF